MNPEQLRDASLLELFALEAEAQTAVLNDGLLALERDPGAARQLEACMRAAHSLKGAARIVGLEEAVRVAHAMEDCLVAAQQGSLRLSAAHIDALLEGTDLLQRIGQPGTAPHEQVSRIEPLLAQLEALLAAPQAPAAKPSAGVPAPEAVAAEARALSPAVTEPDLVAEAMAALSMPDFGSLSSLSAPATPSASATPNASDTPTAPAPQADGRERVLRVNAETLNQLLAMAAEGMVESNGLRQFGDAMQQMRRLQMRATRALDTARAGLSTETADQRGLAALAEAQDLLAGMHRQFAEHLAGFEQYDHRASRLSRRLYDTALACRMRPLSDAIAGHTRMVRDLGRTLGKQVRLELSGAQTQVDRDILEQLDAPLAHLLRNAADHGIEPPAQRVAQGKPAEGCITLHARHNAGRLIIEIADDGAGVDLERLRSAIVRRGLASEQTAGRLSQGELLEFLLLPGFSMRDTVSEISGRGVGLDAVQEMIRQVHGSLRLSQRSGEGMQIHLELPLTLSVVRALLVEVDGEAYAFPLGRVQRATSVPRDAIEQLEGRQHFHFRFAQRQVGLVEAAQVLQRPVGAAVRDEVPVVVIGEHEHTYGIAVDRLLGERTLVVQPLAEALGKVKDIAAGSLTDDGTPVLIFDIDDLLRSVERLVAEGGVARARQAGTEAETLRRRRVLVVDDSLTVRELERKLLAGRGYDVGVAVDGMDGWNMLRAESFDLVITDIDMPRMDGIELVTRMKQDTALRPIPVMVVSYKDREQDRRRGLEAGADYYLAKGSFHDTALLDAVRDLIGEARA